MARSQETLFGESRQRHQDQRGLAQRLCDSQHTLQQIQQRQEECRLLWQSEAQLQGDRLGASLAPRMAEAGIGDHQSCRAEEILAGLRGAQTAP